MTQSVPDSDSSISGIMPSSVIAAMHYDEASRVLTIIYRGGRGTYRYFDVPAEEHAAFYAAPSKGTYLNEVFKTRGYRYEKAAERGETAFAKENHLLQKENHLLQ